jgi:hypothetical protein
LNYQGANPAVAKDTNDEENEKRYDQLVGALLWIILSGRMRKAKLT